jgi:hypothetical protein
MHLRRKPKMPRLNPVKTKMMLVVALPLDSLMSAYAMKARPKAVKLVNAQSFHS